MRDLTLKAYYKALTTTKAYITQEDISTNFMATRYKATNAMPKDEILDSYDTIVLSTDYYYENLEVAANMVDTLSKQWTKDCYYYEWEDYLKRYDMSVNQYTKLLRLINKDS